MRFFYFAILVKMRYYFDKSCVNCKLRFMTLKTYILGMTASVILCSISWILIVIYIDPSKTNLIGLSLFYLSLFFCLTGLFALIGFYARKKIFMKNEAEFSKIEITFRQGFFLSLIFVGILFLQSFRMLYWWNALIFVVVIIFLELCFLEKNNTSREKKKRSY